MRRTLEAIGLLALALLFFVTWRSMAGPNRLPDRIPTHFDLQGHPNGWGSPAGLILLPAIALVLYCGITLIARFPGAFNYPVRVTAENRARLEAITVNMMAWIKVEIVCLFTWIQLATIQLMREGRGGLSPMLFPLGIAAIFVMIGWHIVALVRSAGPMRAR